MTIIHPLVEAEKEEKSEQAMKRFEESIKNAYHLGWRDALASIERNEGQRKKP